MTLENDVILARLEQLGPSAVRTMMQTGGFPTGWQVRIVEWLAQKDQEEQRLAASSQVEQMEIARSASTAAERAASAAERASMAAERQATAAERANTRATIALAIAIISIIVSAIGIWLPYWEAHK